MVGTVLVGGLIGIAMAFTSPAEMFKVRCPKCGTEFVQSPPAIITNSATQNMNGTNYVRDILMACPKCQNEFSARSMKFVETPVAYSLPDIPMPLPARLTAPIVPVRLERLATVDGAIYVLSLPQGYELDMQSMGGMAAETLLSLHATNRPMTWVITVRKKP